jgi:hypothetical protein
MNAARGIGSFAANRAKGFGRLRDYGDRLFVVHVAPQALLGGPVLGMCRDEASSPLRLGQINRPPEGVRAAGIVLEGVRVA